MPKVSADYLAQRRQDILSGAKRTFTRNGFHATTMQDLFAESGLSAGAFYRYFDSKQAVIAAIVQEAIGDIVATLLQEGTRDGASIADAIAAAVDVVAARDEAEAIAPLAVQVWGEALRDPELAEQLTGAFTEAKRRMTTQIRREQRSGRLPGEVRADALTAALFCILPGYVVQRALLGPKAVAQVPEALRALFAGPAAVG